MFGHENQRAPTNLTYERKRVAARGEGHGGGDADRGHKRWQAQVPIQGGSRKQNECRRGQSGERQLPVMVQQVILNLALYGAAELFAEYPPHQRECRDNA